MVGQMESIYLRDIPLKDAWARLEAALEKSGMSGVLGREEIPLDDLAVGRVLAEPVWAKISSPHYHASAMDGYAVRAASTSDAQLSKPVVLACLDRDAAVRSDDDTSQAIYLDTGDPLPDWADAVIPIEQVEAVTENAELAVDVRRPAGIRIRAAVAPWQHVRSLGEDIIATQLVLPAGHTLRPVDLGAIAASGNAKISVARKPRVAVMPTGTELLPLGKAPGPGEIIEFNALVLSSQVNQWGGEATRYAILPDSFEQIRQQVLQATDNFDLILLNAGSSAGSEDYSARVVESLGELLVHGVAVRPGHPVILGVLHKAAVGSEENNRDTLLIGVPGYPVSAALTGEIFVEPLLARWTGRPAWQPQTIKATLTRKLTSPAGDDDYLRVVAGRVGDRILAAPLARGAGVITSLARADGIVIIPAGSQGLPAGAEVDVRLYRQPHELEQTIFVIGSHDMVLDLAGQFLAGHNRRLVSANVGSQGGLVALRRGECHFTGSHLLDPASGQYNLTYVHQYLPGVPVNIVDFVQRQQGLMVRPGNPHKINSLTDLAKPGVRFANRQRGAGTRVLLDYHLEREGIDPQAINGYEHEEFTHLAVAAAVASGRFDAGLGIAAAAQALDLDFIPLFSELYQLIIPLAYYSSGLLLPFLELIASPKFQAIVDRLPGYASTGMGRIAAVFQ